MTQTDNPTAQGVALLDDERFYEVVDGTIVELAPMGANEGWLASELLGYLMSFARQHRLGRAVQEVLFNLSPAVQRKRRPDVAFVSYARWPRQRGVPHAEAWDVVPNLAVEVVSPSNTWDEIVNKVAEYFRAGVECVWVIFASQEQVYVYDSPTRVRILTRADELTGEPVLLQFRLPVAALFEDLEATEPTA